MASPASLRAILIPAIAGCAVLGGYAGMYRMFVNGMTESVENGPGRDVDPFVPGGVNPFKNSYTGVAVIDGWLMMLVPFFSYMLDTPHSWGLTASFWYLAVTYFAALFLLYLEGMRPGNVGRSVSWVGTLGFVAQSISYTIAAPLYFILHIFTSPTASPSVSAADVMPADPAEPRTLLLSHSLTYLIPTIGMILPAPSAVSASTHYNWIAIWQPFPIWYSITQSTLTRLFSTLSLFGSAASHPANRSSALSTAVVYRTVIALTVTAHLTLLTIALTPASLIPTGYPTLTKIFSEVTIHSSVLPPSLVSPPSVDGKINNPHHLAPLSHFFLIYDVYCGSFALLLWAAYLRIVAGGPRGETVGWSGVLAKAVGWTAVGGPIAAAAALLWERDEVLVRRDGVVGKKRL